MHPARHRCGDSARLNRPCPRQTKGGFLRLDVGPDAITGKYYKAPRPQESWSQPPSLVETFRLNLKTNKVT